MKYYFLKISLKDPFDGCVSVPVTLFVQIAPEEDDYRDYKHYYCYDVNASPEYYPTDIHSWGVNGVHQPYDQLQTVIIMSKNFHRGTISLVTEVKVE